jgi:polyphenol oxidase
MNDAFRWTTVNSREYLECVPLAEHARHLFSTRQLPLPADFAERRRNIDVFAGDLGVAAEDLLRAKQVHGRNVLVIDSPTREPAGSVDADAIVSAVSGTACAVQIADCVPILIYSAGHIAAAVHAGWRGTVAGVAAAAVQAMARLGSDPSTMVAAMGPSIGPCCYQVDARVRDVFVQSAQWPAAERAFMPDGDAHWRLDVPAINRQTLERAGIPGSQIHESGLCTACDLSRFYSYRAEGAGTGRLIAGIVA